jgi:hypothetical protein
MRQLAVFALIAVFATSPSVSLATDDLPPSFDEVLSLLQLDPSVKQRALAGEIVMLDREDSTDKELAVALVAVIKRPYDEVIDAVRGNRLFQFNKYILDFAQIEGAPDVSKFQGLGFTTSEADEVKALLAVEPGKEFNLSAEEIERFRQLQTEAEGLDDEALIATVNGVLRAFLAERLRRYQQTGLGGIASYQRSGKDASSPAEELNAATGAMEDMKRSAPNFYSILQKFPDARVEEVEHRFYVFKLNIAGRPGFILSHRVYFFGTEFALLAERHIYAPHFYNSLQLVAGVIPHENSSVLFYGNRTYTDEVAGFGSGVKHSVGGAQLAKGIKALLTDIRAGIESGQAK